jgi:hypothetical protein
MRVRKSLPVLRRELAADNRLRAIHGSVWFFGVMQLLFDLALFWAVVGK